MLEEWNDTRSNRDQLLWRHVHVVHVFTFNLEHLITLTACDAANEIALVVEFGIRLRNHVRLFLVGVQVFDFVSYVTIHNLTVWSFNETKFIDGGVK